MAAIRSKDTKPEMIVRHGLWKRGFRYRLNYKRLPGHPDLVLRKYRTCIFVNGCFWHGHDVDMIQPENSKCCKIPKTNRDFWVEKIRKNTDAAMIEAAKLSDQVVSNISAQEIRRTQDKESVFCRMKKLFRHDIFIYTLQRSLRCPSCQ